MRGAFVAVFVWIFEMSCTLPLACHGVNVIILRLEEINLITHSYKKYLNTILMKTSIDRSKMCQMGRCFGAANTSDLLEQFDGRYFAVYFHSL